MSIEQSGIIKQAGNDNQVLALGFLYLGIKYLHLVSCALEENMKQGNSHLLASDRPIDGKDYDDATKWSDFNIIVPVLYNFYHGLELIMKGLLFLFNEPDIRAEHGLTSLLSKIESLQQLPLDIKKILKNHLDVPTANNPLIVGFLAANKIGIDQLYEALRYPSERKFRNIYSYFELHYLEKRALEYFSKVIEDIDLLRKQIVPLYHKVVGPITVTG